MAEVYAAMDRRTNQPVIVKKILPELSEDKNFIRMFLEEAKILSRIHHPNVVEILDFGRFGNSYFIALEYIGGKNLRVLMDKVSRLKSRIPVPLAIHTVVKILKGLDYVHHQVLSGGDAASSKNSERKIIHRDISPDNVLISFSGDIKIIDFGIAKESSDLGRTRTGMLKGKLGYIAPEQIFSSDFDERVDLYSTGVILYEMITGQKLMNLDLTSSFRAEFKKYKPIAPRKIDPKLPEMLEDIILKAIDRDPDYRYQSAKEFQIDLIEFVDPENYKSIVRMDLAKYVGYVLSQETGTNAGNTGSRSRIATQPSEGRIIAQNNTAMRQNMTQMATEGNFRAANDDARTVIGKLAALAPNVDGNPEATIYADLRTRPGFFTWQRMMIAFIIFAFVGLSSSDRLGKNPVFKNALSFGTDLIHLSRGNSAFQKGDHELAFRELSQVKNSMMKTPDLILKMGQLSRATHNTDGALDELKELDQYKTDIAHIYLEQGNIYYSRDEKAKALENYEKFLVLAPNDEQVPLVKKHMEEMKPSATIKQLESSAPASGLADSLNPLESATQKPVKNPQTLIAEGDAYFKKNNYKGALRKYQSALEDAPENKGIYLRIGRTYSKMYDYSKAINFYVRVTDMDKKNKEAYREMGLLYAEMGEVDEAVNSLQKYIPLEKNTALKVQYEDYLNELMN
jgi:serine/threonine protein kinase/Flp pilus assembly protein TadD